MAIGAKGMISLDSSVSGNALMLRESMVKFQALESHEIEICGAGINPLSLILNRQNIKILEDLGVGNHAFLDLQTEELSRLRPALQSPIHTAEYIAGGHIAKTIRLPWLIGTLYHLRLHFVNDAFLRQAVELTVLAQLHDLKYRGRIPVKGGVTLYGVMDETGYLKENQIYCPMGSDPGGIQMLVARGVVITRSPALYPGDVQLVDAVEVPKDSPLRRLHNCVVFSQKGDRDLPSKLSGGDLDGDLYNVIWNARLKPRRTAQPADYPRVEDTPLSRTVTTPDMIAHFLTFMRQDQLARIATQHLVMADQLPLGTFDPDCLLLAELHSQAVDFSKTGIPVSNLDLQDCPSADRR